MQIRDDTMARKSDADGYRFDRFYCPLDELYLRFLKSLQGVVRFLFKVVKTRDDDGHTFRWVLECRGGGGGVEYRWVVLNKFFVNLLEVVDFLYVRCYIL